MRVKARRERGRPTAGFTIIELMIYLVMASVVMAVVFRLMVAQSRSYGDQRQVRDVGETMRGATMLLTWELRQLAASDGDLYSLGTNNLVLRSMQGGGIVCGKHITLPRYGLWGVSGEVTDGDSALVFMAGGGGTTDDAWRAVLITSEWSPAGGGVPWCDWSGGNTVGTEAVVHVSSDTSAVATGAPFRTFRRVEYGTFQQDGRWWLGRRVDGSATWELMTGPLRSPADGGLVFAYYDSTGAVTANPLQVHRVEIAIRAESYGRAHRGGTGPVGEGQDSVRTRVYLRG